MAALAEPEHQPVAATAGEGLVVAGTTTAGTCVQHRDKHQAATAVVQDSQAELS